MTKEKTNHPQTLNEDMVQGVFCSRDHLPTKPRQKQWISAVKACNQSRIGEEKKKEKKTSLLIKSLTVVFPWIHKSELKAVLLVEKEWTV